MDREGIGYSIVQSSTVLKDIYHQRTLGQFVAADRRAKVTQFWMLLDVLVYM